LGAKLLLFFDIRKRFGEKKLPAVYYYHSLLKKKDEILQKFGWWGIGISVRLASV